MTIKLTGTVESKFEAAERGTQVVYHNGLLMRDRQNEQHVHSRAEFAWAMHKAGKACLVQRRVTPGSCCYIMVKV